MSSFKHTYILKQETPLIHFQHDQAGATLRASEVKPKLDRFLCGKYGLTENVNGSETPKKEYKSWFIGDTTALDYKMRMTVQGGGSVSRYGYFDKLRFSERDRDQQKEYRKKRDSEIKGFYYGNMIPERENNHRLTPEEYNRRVDEQCKETVKYNSVTLTVICFIPDLCTKIEDGIEEFFFVTNFGTCQSKGYGSFTVDGRRYQPVDISNMLKQYYGAQHCYYFDAGNDALGRIKTVYQMMKSGLNLGNGRYRRSLLFMYMHKEYGIGNEKAWMKQEGIAPAVMRDDNPHDYHANDDDKPVKYVRALLGVGDTFRFQKEAGQPFNTMEVSVDQFEMDENGEHMLDRNGDPVVVVERFPSTVFFKVIGEKVYMVGKRIPELIFDRNYFFDGAGTEWDSGDISTPDKTLTSIRTGETVEMRNFLDGFLHYCFDKFENPPNGEKRLSQFLNQNINLKEV